MGEGTGQVKKITMTTAKWVLWEMYRTGESALEIVEQNDLWELDFKETLEAVDKVIKDNPKAVADYKGG